MKRANNNHRIAKRDAQIGFRCPSRWKDRLNQLVDQTGGLMDLTDVFNDLLPEAECRLLTKVREMDKRRAALLA